MCTMCQRFLQDKTEMGRLCTITIGIVGFVIMLLHSPCEQAAGIVNILANFGNVGKLQGCPVFLNNIHERNIVKIELILIDVEFALWEFKGLFDQIDVLFHGIEIRRFLQLYALKQI